jgi:uncharacterized protein
VIGEGDLPAGGFSAWITDIEAAIRGERGSDVPCGTCTACCTSSQFIHIAPSETDTLAHIPKALLFPAPGLPPGHVLMGFDEHGRCPMLIDDACSIYPHRPVTCRTYDCRVFPAAGVAPDDDKALIARRAERWQFSYPTPNDRVEQAAVHAAATFVGEHRAALPRLCVPATATQLAVLAVELHRLFMRTDPATGEMTAVAPDPQAVGVELTRRARSDTGAR